jgi:hypothetical protein
MSLKAFMNSSLGILPSFGKTEKFNCPFTIATLRTSKYVVRYDSY